MGLGSSKPFSWHQSSISLSARKRSLHSLQSIRGSEKPRQMAGGHPGLGVHEDGGVQTHVVGVLLHEFLPPGLLDVVLQLHAQGAVVPRVGQAAVDLSSRRR